MILTGGYEGAVRDSFNDIWHLITHYQYYKLKLEGSQAVFPKPHAIIPDPTRARSQREDMLCFVADVEKFIKFYYVEQPGYVPVPHDCLTEIFRFKFCRHLTPYTSYNHLARKFRFRRRNGERLPKRITYSSHICDIGSDMEKKAEIYFRNKGLLIEPQKMPTL